VRIVQRFTHWHLIIILYGLLVQVIKEQYISFPLIQKEKKKEKTKKPGGSDEDHSSESPPPPTSSTSGEKPEDNKDGEKKRKIKKIQSQVLHL